MASTADLALNPTPAILLVGDSGTWKTRFLASAPEILGVSPSSVYLFDFDKGASILRGIEGIEYDTFKDVPRAPTGAKPKAANPKMGLYEFGSAWPAFIKKLNEIGDLMDKGESPYKLLSFDSLTTLADICMNYVLKSDGHAGSPQIQHWGSQIQLLSGVMDQLTSWEVIKVVTAHIQRNTNDVTQVVEMLPLVTGKLAGKVSIYFDEVYFTSVTTKNVDRNKFPYGQFTLITGNNGMMKQAKSRFGVPEGTSTEFKSVWPYIHSGALGVT